METSRTESEIRETCKNFSKSDLKFAIRVNNFLKFFCTEWGLFLLYFGIISIPLFIFYQQFLENSMFFGGIFLLLQAGCFIYARRNPKKLQKDIEEFEFENSIYQKLIEERN
jgi:hypothetical protein